MPGLKVWLSTSTPPADLATGTWRALAACRDHPTLPAWTWDDSAVGHRETAETREQRISVAISVCNYECPVRQQCADDVDLRFDEGVRGGEDLRDVRVGIWRSMPA